MWGEPGFGPGLHRCVQNPVRHRAWIQHEAPFRQWLSFCGSAASSHTLGPASSGLGWWKTPNGHIPDVSLGLLPMMPRNPSLQFWTRLCPSPSTGHTGHCTFQEPSIRRQETVQETLTIQENWVHMRLQGLPWYQPSPALSQEERSAQCLSTLTW